MLIKKKKKSIVIVHGVFENSFFETLREKGIQEVFVLEGRPYLDGAKVLCPKLLKNKIQPILIADNMAGALFYYAHLVISFLHNWDTLQN